MNVQAPGEVWLRVAEGPVPEGWEQGQPLPGELRRVPVTAERLPDGRLALVLVGLYADQEGDE